MLFIVRWFIIFTGVRVAVMEFALAPLAHWLGIGKKKGQIRFAEQAWVFLYYGTFWTLGMVCGDLAVSV